MSCRNLVNVLRGEMSLVGPRPLPLRDVRRSWSPSSARATRCSPGSRDSGRSTVAVPSPPANSAP